MFLTFLTISPATQIALLGAVILVLGVAWPRPKVELAQKLLEDASAHVFAFRQRELVAASATARTALSEADFEEDVFHQLLARLGAIFPEIDTHAAGIEAGGNPVELLEVTQDGPVQLKMQLIDDDLFISVTGLAAPLSRSVIMDEDQFLRRQADADFLDSAIEASPVPSWREDAKGNIDWVNRAYSDLLDISAGETRKNQWPPTRLFDGARVVQVGEEPRPRRSAIQMKDGSTRMYETASVGHGNGTLHYALDATATALAEDSLRNFLQTLTQTFAYLPIGLAIFDRARHLVMFNPALLDLTSLQPAWLSARPTLYDVLNALREKRMVPERKDFKDWRSQLVEVEQAAKNGTFCETWTLPNGQIYRVTGRPHPEGAIAFLIEDISAEITLKRKFRRELATRQSILDNLPAAVVVLDNQGIVRSLNQPFLDMWSLDEAEMIDKASVVSLTKLWSERCHPNPIWGEVRDFVRQRSERAEWSGTVLEESGRTLQCRVAPLPGGGTLLTFADPITTPMPRAHIRDKARSTLSA